MITDFILDLVLDVLEGIAGMLPDHSLSLPDVTPITGLLAEIDSVIPIAGPIQAAIGMLAVVGVFFIIRAILLVWKALPLT